MADNEISILVKAEVAAAVAKIKDLEKQSKTTAQTIENGFTKAANALKGFLAAAGIALVTKGFKDMYEAGVDFLDLTDDFQTVFAGIAGDAVKMRDSLTNSLGLATNDVTSMLSKVGLLGQSMGMATEDSLKFAGKITELGTALSRFLPGNISTADAVNSLTQAINGSEKGLKQLGITITDGEKIAEGQRQGITKSLSEWTKAEMAQVTLAIAYEKSAKALEGLASGNDSIADRIEKSRNAFKNITTGIGVALAQALDKALPKMGTLASSVDTVAQVAGKVIAVVKALGQTMLLAISVPASVVIETVKSLITITKTASALASDLLKGNFAGAAVEAKTLALQIKEGVTGIITAPLDVLKSTANSYVDAYKAVTSEIVVVNAENNSAILKQNDDRIAKSLAAEGTKTQKQIEEEQKLADKRKQLQAEVDAFVIAGEQDQTVKKQAELDKQYQNALDAANQLGMDTTAIRASYAAQVAEIERQASIQVAQQWISAYQAIGNAASSVGDFIAQIVQNQVDAENEGGKEITKEQKKRLRDTAIAQKAFAIFSAGVNTAAAIVAQLTNPVPFAGAALSIAAGIAGAAQIANIVAKPLPELYTGGIVNGPTLAMVGERGREAVLPNDLTELLLDAAGAGGGSNSTINIGQVVANDPQQFAAAMDRYVKRNGKLINT